MIYRVHPGQINNTKSAQRPKYSKRARKQAFAHFGVELTDDEIDGLFSFVNDDDLHDFGVCRQLRDKCRNAMQDADYALFERELSFRIFKAGLRCISDKRLGMALGSGEFWRAALRFWYWPFYRKSLQFSKG